MENFKKEEWTSNMYKKAFNGQQLEVAFQVDGMKKAVALREDCKMLPSRCKHLVELQRSPRGHLGKKAKNGS